MTHKDLADLNLATLRKCAPETLQAQAVSAVILALGSNYQAEKHLPQVRKALARLGELQLSTAFQNPDFTATVDLPKPNYTNQCIYLSLTSPVAFEQLQKTFKQFESDCDRQRLTELQTPIKQVTMDIDILLIKLVSHKNSLSKNKVFRWVIMTDRYPFKEHERAGLEELIAGKRIDC